MCPTIYIFFFFNDTATTEIYTLSLHDALPICQFAHLRGILAAERPVCQRLQLPQAGPAQTGLDTRSEEHTSELQSPDHLVCRLLLEKKKYIITHPRVPSDPRVRPKSSRLWTYN